MRFEKTWIGAVFVVAALASPVPAIAQAPTPRETLSQLVAELRKNPGDDALREKIVRLAREMKPAPAIPAEVDELVGQAKYVFKHAKERKDYLDAVDAYRKAVALAPWVGDYYYNLGVAQEQAGLPLDAVKSFNLYLAAAPDAKDAREVRERIGGLKYAAGRTARESGPETVAARERKKTDDWLGKVEGKRYRYAGTMAPGARAWADVRNGTFVSQMSIPGSGTSDMEQIRLQGRETTVTIATHPDFLKVWTVSKTYIISESGDRITQRTRFSDGDTRDYFWIQE